MNNFFLTKPEVIMNELIKIHTYQEKRVISARILQHFLGNKQDFSTWIKMRIEKYGFIEDQDYYSFHKIVEREVGATSRIEYALSIDMAKELCMIENNDRGRQARQYFIMKEKEANNKPALTTSRKELAIMILQAEEEIEKLTGITVSQDKTIQKLAPKAEVFDRAMDSSGLVDIGQVAKLLGLPFGRNKLFEKLRERGVFFKHKNEPKQKYIDRGYFRLKEMTIDRPGDKPILYLKVLVTQKGLLSICKSYGGNLPVVQVAKIS
jgi:anti-repressor protein